MSKDYLGTHDFSGATLVGAGAPMKAAFSTDFSSSARYTESTVDGGVSTYTTNGYTADSSTTTTSSEELFCRGATNSWPAVMYDNSPEFMAGMHVGTEPTTGSLMFAGGTFILNGTGITNSATNHLGFKAVYAAGVDVLSATNGNQSTETATDITAGIDISDGVGHVFHAVQDGSTDIKYYVDGTLEATHTTNLPSGGTNALPAQLGVSNNSTTSQTTATWGHASLYYAHA